MPNLDNLIKAIDCEGWLKHECEHCPYDYQYWDDHGDNAFWWCNEEKIMEDALFYLKICKHLIEKYDVFKDKELWKMISS